MSVPDKERDIVLDMYHDTEVRDSNRDLYNSLVDSFDVKDYTAQEIIDTLKLMLITTCRMSMEILRERPVDMEDLK
jgi:hypothetical protein